ncbi:hypothetical protein [Aliarcobacter butzleri]|uniref:Replication initiation protein n=1 Tax=Aliarcobacter butzleri L351 TaxID=1447259 RepID=A0A837J5U4_9BACT|nr:hypothetical protein [Aliarcobacter butzleri]KLE00940.1 hypothetical protein AF76_05720 [Aliarcobacter butzleri L351]KLE12848.1 hypothetical protein AF75_06725 [Aliarcobacter butzleri L350]
MISNDLVIKDSCRNYIINEYFEKKEVKQNRDYKVKFIEIGNTRNLSGYILIKQNLESVSTSKSRKKQKNFYCEVIFAGLRQPTKHISISTYEILSLFIKRFKVSDLDICFDGLSELDINKNTLNMYRYLFKDYISNFKNALIEKSSFYINIPSSPLADTDYFKKIIVYDKYLKENRYKNLDDELKNWKRLEITVNIKFKFKDFVLDDYLEDMQEIAKKYFNVLSFSYDYLHLQNNLLTDRRTLKAKEISLN